MQTVARHELGTCKTEDTVGLNVTGICLWGFNSNLRFFLTSDLGLEGASDDVVRTTIFDRDEIVAGGHWGVCDPVSLRAFHAVHLHLGGPVDGYS